MDIRQIGASALTATASPDRVQGAPAPVDANKPADSGTVQAQPSEHQVTQALKSINELLQTRSPDLEFSVDGDSDRTVVKVVDTKTREVIRQMPTQEALDIAKALDRLHSMLIRQTA